MEPKLAADGCNWHTYGSWVLKAISEDDLMGYLEGSETRPTHPSLLQGDGDGWTPQTDEEREAVTVWRTADDAWQQRAAMAHYLIISGIPDSVLMLIMHLESPRDAFTYLESRYGQIPRPECSKVVDEVNREHNLPFEQCAAEDSTQSAEIGNNEPLDSPGEEIPSNFPSDCAKTTDGHAEPETEVMDAQQVEGDLLKVADRAMDLERPDELADAPREERIPDLEDESLDGGHSDPGYWVTLSNNGYELVDPPIEDNRCLSMDDETTANVPDPPGTHAELPNPQVESSTLRSEPEVTGSMLKDPSKESERSSQLRETERPEPHRDRTSEGKFRIYEGRFTSDTPPNEAWGMGVHRPTQVGLGDSTDVEAKATKLEIRPVSAKMAGMQDTIPVPPEPPPNAPTRTPSTFVDPHRYGRPTSRAERVSNKCTRRNACRARAVFVRPLTFLLAPSRRSRYPAGGLWMTKIGCRKVRYAKRVEMRGYTHRGSHTSVSPPHEVLQCLWNISNTFWLQWVPPVSMLNDTGWPTNLPMAEWLPVSSGTRREYECRAKWPNDLPVPSKPARIDFAHTPGTLREPHRRGRIKTRSKNVSTVKTRGAKASILPIPTSPPCDISQHLWNVANTYWRHGIPPEHTRSVDKPLLFETAASQQRHKAEDEHTANGFPKWKLQQRGASNTTKHRPYSHGLEALLAEACTLIYWIYY